MARPRKVTDGPVHCRKCGVTLAQVIYDGQALAIGAVLVWNALRVFCSRCDLPVTWQPMLPRDELSGERRRVSEQIRNALGRDTGGY